MRPNTTAKSTAAVGHAEGRGFESRRSRHDFKNLALPPARLHVAFCCKRSHCVSTGILALAQRGGQSSIGPPSITAHVGPAFIGIMGSCEGEAVWASFLAIMASMVVLNGCSQMISQAALTMHATNYQNASQIIERRRQARRSPHAYGDGTDTAAKS